MKGNRRGSKFFFIFIFFLLILPVSYQWKTVSAVAMTVEEYLNQSYEDVVKESKQSAENEENGYSESSPLQIGVADVLQMIFSLLLVLVILYGLLKFIQKKSQTYQQSKLIQHLGGTSLGSNRSLQIVKVGQRLFILGVGENIHLIKEIHNQEEIENLIKPQNGNYEQKLYPRFSQMFEKMGQTSSKVNNGSFQELLKNQLEEIKNSRKSAMEKLERKDIKDE